MGKSYVLDTNVLLQSPYAVYAFGDNEVVIPQVVLEEMDRFKKEPTENGANARQCARLLDQMRVCGDLIKGVTLPDGGVLRIELNFHDVELPEGWEVNKADNRILKVCKGLCGRNKQAILVTKDIFLRIKADVIGVTAQDFQSEQVAVPDSQYSGRTEAYVDAKDMQVFFDEGCLSPGRVFLIDEETLERRSSTFYMHQFVVLRCAQNNRQTALCRFDGERLTQLRYLEERPFGVTARNVGQRFMQEALMMSSEEAPLVIVKGAAGTAKTFFSLAVGLHKILELKHREYSKILVCRPNVKFDEDIGFLPGTEKEKLAPFLRSVIDNLEILVDSDEKERYKNQTELNGKVDELFSRNVITMEAIAYIRGRSIQRNWVIIDEAQNLSPKQVKGIVTRAGRGTKLILIGDPAQIDHPYLDSRTNGLCYASERMKGSPFCCQLSMTDDECERSPLAYDSAVRMSI